MNRSKHPSFGIVGGLSALAGADVFNKLMKTSLAVDGERQRDAILEQHPFPESIITGAAGASQSARKFYVFDMLRSFQERRMDAALLPCFISQTFLDELKAELSLPIVDLLAAIRRHVEKRHPAARRLGVLTSDYVRRDGLFERNFDPAKYEVVHPRPGLQNDFLMPAIYGPSGLKSGRLEGDAIILLKRCCRDLVEQGADLILPGFTEIPVVLASLGDVGVPVIDCNLAYVQYALDMEFTQAEKIRKVGVVGGVGPAATVNFLDKIVRNTPARTDQEHIKLVVEQNPQIPDRTANLVADGADPTLALYAACKKLESADADMIAIPCNTAHAFVERIQPHLRIPIVNMLFETIQYIQRHHPEAKEVGLLATDGTVKSRIYQEIAEQHGLHLSTPDEPYQRRVMEAIYGASGVKSGFTTGKCEEDLRAALEHLVRDKGATVAILGCTELPLIMAQSDDCLVAGRHVAVVDPTEILARKCVELARQG
ncbi:MAG TPA: amino acid racemase [Holophaga sp.]|nr:amino acid racemase [Holophaga sp.]HPS66777.1 amino acid racemase [Holophaga sp.]